MKKLLCVILAVWMILSVAACVPARSERTEEAAMTPVPTERATEVPTEAVNNDALLVDQASLLSASEKAEILQALNTVSSRYGVDVVIVTADTLDGKSPAAYADDYYDYHDYAENGLLLLIDMEGRSYWLSTTGSCISVFSDSVIDEMGDEFVPFLSSGSYAEAFRTFIRGAENALRGVQTPAESSNTFVFETIAIDLPEGFTPTELYGVKGAVPADYPTHTDNITFTSTGPTSAKDYTRRMFEDQFAAAFQNDSGLLAYQESEINGIPALLMSHSFGLEGVNESKQEIVLLFTETKTVCITFTSVSGDYDAAFGAAASSIRAA